MNKTKLLPCPFCGCCDPELSVCNDTGQWFASCIDCFARSARWSFKKQVIAAWNRRSKEGKA